MNGKKDDPIIAFVIIRTIRGLISTLLLWWENKTTVALTYVYLIGQNNYFGLEKRMRKVFRF